VSYLDQIISGNNVKQKGQKLVISGVEGIGKTTLACQAPQSLLIPLEGAPSAITTARLKSTVQTWVDVENVCKEITAVAQQDKFPYKSIVWDSATALERIVHAETLNRDTDINKKKLGKTHSMETSHDGYGKAYPIANGIFESWMRYNDDLAEYAGVNIIVTCHIFVVRVIDPSAGEYDTFELLLHSPKNNKTYGKREYLTQWADLIGFLHENIVVTKNKDEKISRGIDMRQGRVLETERSPAWTAKNRYRLTQPIFIPLEGGWNHLAQAIWNASGIDLFNRGLA
jgi:hypothetical protein